MSQPRVTPLKPEQLNQKQARFLQGFTDKSGRYPNVFGVLAHHMELVEAWQDFGLYTLQRSQVDPVLREVAILQTALNLGSEYEWHHHFDIAKRLNVSDSVLQSIRERSPLVDPKMALMVACANDLHEATRLSNAVWQAMIETFGLNYTLDVIFTVGAYTTMAMALNSCDVELE